MLHEKGNNLKIITFLNCSFVDIRFVDISQAAKNMFSKMFLKVPVCCTNFFKLNIALTADFCYMFKVNDSSSFVKLTAV